MKNSTPTPTDVIDYWIGDAATDPEALGARTKLWYGGGKETDDAIRERFGDALSGAERGELAAWRDTPDGCLALVILLDQFSRNLYRGTAKAFSNDAAAQEVARHALAQGFERVLSPIGRAFLYHPFHHAETLSDQQRCVSLYQALLDETPEPMKSHMNGFLTYAIEHHDVVARFGRFPHRNKVLGRESTPEEVAYLEAGAARYGQ
ncbi:MAG: DUF924 domain-containing protein [Pseudomonadales bacterium]|nr:DUF924 domain-containing protein [Pseudomonadales bacterium]